MSKKECKVNFTIRVFQTDLDVTIPISEKENYLKAAEYLTQKIEAFSRVYASSKPLMEIMLLVMLDITHNSIIKQNKLDLLGIWKRVVNKK